MKQSKHLFVKVLGTIMVVLMWGGMVFAGAGPEPPAGSTITGPEIWGVVVINCDNGTGTIRVKRVVECNTESEAKAGAWPGCPASVADVEGFSLTGGTTFFGIGTPFVNKVKNFQKVGGIVSFDAQFKFFY